MRKHVSILLVAFAATSALAQVRTPRASPSATLMQTVGLTDITIKYSRPGVKGRTVWGALVPYDKVWRTGANEATTIAFSDDVLVNGNKLTKGTYAIETIPGQEQWTVIFNRVADQWGAFQYDATKDALRIQARPQTADFREWLTFEIPELTTDTATVVLRWEKVAVPFTIDTQSTDKTLKALKNAMQPDWRTPYQAASFGFDNKGAATDAEMNAWLDQSLKVNQNTNNLWLKARLAQRSGNLADAVRYGEMAVAAATPAQTDLANEIRKTLDSWKK
jgi:hypothetical protein